MKRVTFYECKICTYSGGKRLVACESHLLSKKHQKKRLAAGQAQTAHARIAAKEELARSVAAHIELELARHGFLRRPSGKWTGASGASGGPPQARRLRLFLKNAKFVKEDEATDSS